MKNLSVKERGIQLMPGDSCKILIPGWGFRKATILKIRQGICAYRVKFDDGAINTVSWFSVYLP